MPLASDESNRNQNEHMLSTDYSNRNLYMNLKKSKQTIVYKYLLLKQKR